MPDTDAINSIFRQINREIWIVTAASENRRGGLVATWVAQASLDPTTPVVMIAIAENHFTRELIDASGSFALHTITEDQISLAWRFGIGSGRDRDKLAGLDCCEGTSGSPLLDDCLAWLDCRVFERYDAGDRIYYWADVLAANQNDQGVPLTDQQLFTAATPEQKAELLVGLQADIEVQRPLYADWRKRLGQSG